MTPTWPMIAAERRALADTLDTLSEAQWLSPSALRGWLVRHVVAHLVWPLETSLVKILLQTVPHGFNALRTTDAVAAAERRSGPELAGALRQQADIHRLRLPGRGLESPLTETVVHALDIRVPLGLASAIPATAARIVLDTLVHPRASRGYAPPHRFDGLRLETTDLDWTHGAGPVLSGSVADLLISLAGRGIALDRLQGDALEIVRGRRKKRQAKG